MDAVDTLVESGLTAGMMMAYVLESLDANRCRLSAWLRGRPARPYLYLLDEWVSFVRQRKQRLGIKARAEA